jgi:hypothetical protein
MVLPATAMAAMRFAEGQRVAYDGVVSVTPAIAPRTRRNLRSSVPVGAGLMMNEDALGHPESVERVDQPKHRRSHDRSGLQPVA